MFGVWEHMQFIVVEELCNITDLIKDEVNENLVQSNPKFKAGYNKGKKDTARKSGDWVYLKNESRKNSYHCPEFQVPC